MKKVRSVCVDILKKGSVMKNAKGGDKERRKESREAGIELYIEGRIAKRREESNIPRTLRVRCRQQVLIRFALRKMANVIRVPSG